LTRSPNRPATTAICAKQTARVDVKQALRMEAADVALGRRASLPRVRFDVLGDWNIPLGVVVFVTTLGREAAGNLIDVAARV
jgi:hypothetical protein